MHAYLYMYNKLIYITKTIQINCMLALGYVNGINKIQHIDHQKNGQLWQMKFPNGFSWIEMSDVSLKLHLNVFTRVQLMRSQHWLR